MATLTENITATQKVILVSGSTPDQGHFRIRIDDELMDVEGFDRKQLRGGYRDPGVDRTRWIVTRGVGGTTAATHSAGDTLKAATSALVSSDNLTPPLPFAGGVGGGAIAVTDGVTTVAAATEIHAASVTDLGGGVAGVGSVVFADTDPGAIGARNFWLHTDPNNNATFLQLLVRNDADSGWRHVGWADNYEGALGTMQGQTYDNDGNVTGLFDMNAGSFTITGSGDPVGAGWWQGTVGVNSTSLYLNYLHNNGVNFEIALSTTGIRVTGLPTADPTVAGALWIDTAAGRVIKVSAG